MTRVILLAVLTLMPWVEASAQEPAARVTRGLGTRSCAQFGLAYKQNPQLADLSYGQWALGMMSGMNLQLAVTDNPMRDIPPPAVVRLSLRQLCDQRPVANFFDIVVHYFRSLPEVPRQTRQ